MATLGSLALTIALASALGSAVAAALALRWRAPFLGAVARRGVLATAALTSVATLSLLWSLLAGDYRLESVYNYTSLDLDPLYKISAFWASPQGSLLLWSWLQAMVLALATWRLKLRQPDMLRPFIAVSMLVQALFLTASAFLSDPFGTLAWIPGDGRGLNPLLENLSMAAHPPAVFLGYALFAVPFALATASTLTDQKQGGWGVAGRPWAVAAWLALGIGNLLGAQWAYVELGWGGYWAWDPVENGSLLPWLAGTALLHSMGMQRLRERPSHWVHLFAMLAFCLCLLGTYLVRSGAVSSVHSYGHSPVGDFFLWFLLAMLTGSGSLLALRWRRSGPASGQSPLLSKPGAFLLANSLLLAVAFVVLWGTLYPVISRTLLRQETYLGADYFNAVAPPLFLALLVLLAACPLLTRDQDSPRRLARKLALPLGLTTLALAALGFSGLREMWGYLGFGAALLVVSSSCQAWVGDAQARRLARGEPLLVSFVRLIAQNRPRYGGHIVHVGLALIVVGITGSAVYHSELDFSLAVGQSVSFAGYTLTYEDIVVESTPSRDTVAAVVVLADGNLRVGTLRPQKILHVSYEQPVSEVAIRTTPLHDLYLILQGWDAASGKAVFRVLLNGLIVWMWIGSAVLLLGGLICLWPVPRSRTAGLPG